MKFMTSAALSFFISLFLSNLAMASEPDQDQKTTVTFTILNGTDVHKVAEVMHADPDTFLELLDRVYSLPEEVAVSILIDPKGVSETFQSILINEGERFDSSEKVLQTMRGILKKRTSNKPFNDITFTLSEDDNPLNKALRSHPQEVMFLAIKLLETSARFRGAVLETPVKVVTSSKAFLKELKFVNQVKAGSLSVVRQHAREQECLNPQESLKFYFSEMILSFAQSIDITNIMKISSCLDIPHIRNALTDAAHWVQQTTTLNNEFNIVERSDYRSVLHYLDEGRFTEFFQATDHQLDSQPRVLFMHVFGILGLDARREVDLHLVHAYLAAAKEFGFKQAIMLEDLLKAIYSDDISILEKQQDVSLETRAEALSQLQDFLLPSQSKRKRKLVM